MAGKFLGIDLKRDFDAILLGVAAMYVLMIVPGISSFVFDKLVSPVRGIFGGGKK